MIPLHKKNNVSFPANLCYLHKTTFGSTILHTLYIQYLIS